MLSSNLVSAAAIRIGSKYITAETDSDKIDIATALAMLSIASAELNLGTKARLVNIAKTIASTPSNNNK